MKAILLSIALFGFVAVAPVLAGGDLDVLGQQAYEASMAAKASAIGSVAGSSVGADAGQDANGAAMSDTASSTLGSILGSNPWQMLLVVIIVGVASGLLVWAYRRNKIVQS